MDRSFLSEKSVIDTSRQFVCVRLATYEDELENKFLKSLVHTGSGELENTSFAILSPDGKEKLVRTGRGIKQIFSSSEKMAAKMDEIAKKYSAKSAIASLPTVANVDLGLKVSSADNLPLVVISSGEKNISKLGKLAWSEEWIGRFNYAVAKDKEDWAKITGSNKLQIDSIVVIQPDRFGTKGTILASSTSNGDWALALKTGLEKFELFDKTNRSHIREGSKLGIFYEPKTPVTDPMEQKARERAKKK
jgi:hypothetical protein